MSERGTRQKKRETFVGQQNLRGKRRKGKSGVDHAIERNEKKEMPFFSLTFLCVKTWLPAMSEWKLRRRLKQKAKMKLWQEK